MLNFREDLPAFDHFVNQHKDRVFNTVLGMVQHFHDAEDITQDIFADIYEKGHAFRGEASVQTWLYRIALNKSIDLLRRRRRKLRWLPFSGSLSAEPAPDPGDFIHPGVLAENKEKAAVLFQALKQLPERQQAAWILSETEQLSNKEIAEVMEISVSSTESLLFRARQQLKKILAGFYDQLHG